MRGANIDAELEKALTVTHRILADTEEHVKKFDMRREKAVNLIRYAHDQRNKSQTKLVELKKNRNSLFQA